MVDRLIQLAADLTAGVGHDARLIGGLAVRLHVGAGSRLTRDVDLVPMTPDAEAVIVERLTERGFIVGDARHWRRAIAPETREIVDILRHPIVNPRTFEAAKLRSAPMEHHAAAPGVVVAGAADLARLKLLAGRDQDLVDLVLLSSVFPSPREIAQSAELDELERAVSAGANAVRRALDSGELASCVEELLGRATTTVELDTLRTWLDALKAEGL
ncbi:MAG: hypothetical protein HYV09_02870 [Deltaproteobacteria bacterium]|nr:hypothetical protein [Deltaproteobacteria bacterium]